MLKQQDMTETAAAVLHFLPADKWVTPRMMTGRMDKDMVSSGCEASRQIRLQ
ncbi:hypothetical protein NVE53_004783 [Escherichia coli]|uniref:hypothetical protein n=1 Tax=Escherichia coli TaxID=562 RepID=UPI000250E228|nr:hypothetical protein [Escherichia coli]EHV07111.1 hypothetical protein ECDEC4C_2746 [Escherichia coli DEC4C]EHW27787.1 hypothetical protein ECDEC8E_2886 [Escherichia coli DEC8E]EHL6535733.1 hypothetical protein [Escherichia coli]EHQ5053157.1 hypothetical protein [Escherichia coli]EHW4898946.1 hypothetical protein [Escherichia coli]